MKYRHTDGALVLKFTDDAVVRNLLPHIRLDTPHNAFIFILK